ncbi:hypothetical protein HYX16_00425 [Candidatus Woesearchaeota archaeon]|nr:hypothetical protein [Candidatus Woesearchaeota archaeon]
MKINFDNIGWKSKVTQKRATLSISINKIVATGSCLAKGQTLYSYLAKDEKNRPIILIYLDGKKRIDKFSESTFLHPQKRTS